MHCAICHKTQGVHNLSETLRELRKTCIELGMTPPSPGGAHPSCVTDLHRKIAKIKRKRGLK